MTCNETSSKCFKQDCDMVQFVLFKMTMTEACRRDARGRMGVGISIERFLTLSTVESLAHGKCPQNR